MQRALTALTLHPQVAILLLILLQLLLALDVDFAHAPLTVFADDLLVAGEHIVASEAGLAHLSELEEADVRVAHRRLVNIAHVVSRKEDLLDFILEDGLKYPDKRLLQLVLQVELVVDRQVVLQSVQRVL